MAFRWSKAVHDTALLEQKLLEMFKAVYPRLDDSEHAARLQQLQAALRRIAVGKDLLCNCTWSLVDARSRSRVLPLVRGIGCAEAAQHDSSPSAPTSVLSADAQRTARTDDKKVVAFFTAHEKVSAATQLQPFVHTGSMDRRLVAGADAGLHQLHEQAQKLVEQLPANIIEYVAT
jgi:hypothetical protein